MKLKNFYITEELDEKLSYLSGLYKVSEAKFIRDVLRREVGNLNKAKHLRKTKKYIFNKYKDKCAKCGVGISYHSAALAYPSRDEKTTQVMNLHIHHKNGDKQNNKISNLILLCKNCHYKTHGQERAKRNREAK